MTTSPSLSPWTGSRKSSRSGFEAKTLSRKSNSIPGVRGQEFPLFAAVPWNRAGCPHASSARIALAVLAALAIALFGFSAALRGGVRRAGELYREHFAQRHRERQLAAAVAFYVTFAC